MLGAAARGEICALGGATLGAADRGLGAAVRGVRARAASSQPTITPAELHRTDELRGVVRMKLSPPPAWAPLARAAS